MTEYPSQLIIAGCGSFLGGAARYIISITMKGVSKGFPWGTLLINLAGYLLIGLIWEMPGQAGHDVTDRFKFYQPECGYSRTLPLFSDRPS